MLEKILLPFKKGEVIPTMFLLLSSTVGGGSIYIIYIR